MLIVFLHLILINWHSGFMCQSTMSSVSVNQPLNFRVLTRSNLGSKKVEGSLRMGQTLMHTIWPYLSDPLNASFLLTCNTSSLATLRPSTVSQHRFQYLLCAKCYCFTISTPWNQLSTYFQQLKANKRKKLKLIFTNNLR